MGLAVPAASELAGENPHKLTKSPYDQVCEYIGRLKSEGLKADSSTFSIQISQKDLHDLKALLESVSESKLTRVSYNARSSTLTFKAIASFPHDAAAQFFNTSFVELVSGLPIHLRKRISQYTNARNNGFVGKYHGSFKVPDLELILTDDNGNWVSMLALEVGDSETYEELVDDARFWLEGHPQASTIFLVKMEERPQYQNPVRDAKGLGPRQAAAIQCADLTAETRYMPIVPRDLVWVGEITAFMEIWKRDPRTGSVYQFGDRIVSHQ
ncbi:MAG: hypothetical protein M1839_004977 [Geoglossum umbratile]|nr:MAG: hypothetical protein M1839_004977 [Geoglossum umbratile]